MEQRMPGCFWFSQKSLTTVPVVAYPDTSKAYILCTDPNDDWIGACLCQEQDKQGEMKSNELNEKSIYYLLHILTGSQPNWPTIDKEVFALFYVLQKIDQYLHDS